LYRIKLAQKCNLIIRSLNLVFRSEANEWKYINDEDIENGDLIAHKNFLIIEKIDGDISSEPVQNIVDAEVKDLGNNSFVIDVNKEISNEPETFEVQTIKDAEVVKTTEVSIESSMEKEVEKDQEVSTEETSAKKTNKNTKK